MKSVHSQLALHTGLAFLTTLAHVDGSSKWAQEPVRQSVSATWPNVVIVIQQSSTEVG